MGSTKQLIRITEKFIRSTKQLIRITKNLIIIIKKLIIITEKLIRITWKLIRIIWISFQVLKGYMLLKDHSPYLIYKFMFIPIYSQVSLQLYISLPIYAIYHLY